jgi:hypothetical protein
MLDLSEKAFDTARPRFGVGKLQGRLLTKSEGRLPEPTGGLLCPPSTSAALR